MKSGVERRRSRGRRGATVAAVLLAAAPVLGAATPPPAGPTVAPPAAAGDDGTITRRIVHQGIAVEVTLEPLDPAQRKPGPLREGDDVRFRFRVSDTATGTPLSGLYPAAWMSRLFAGVEQETTSCQKRVEELVGGSFFAQAELDLNVYYVLALNDDPSITVVDPLFGFGGTQLLVMVLLDSPGYDWVLTADQKRLFVSLPESNRVAVVDTGNWKLIDQLPLAPHPARLAMQPDGAYLWVSYGDTADGQEASGESGVAAFDPRRLTLAAKIPTGRGPHEIAFRSDSGTALVTNAGSGTVSLIDVRQLRKTTDVATGGRPVSIDVSSLADAALVSDQARGIVALLDTASGEVVAEIPVHPGVGEVRVAPGGRHAFAVNPTTDEVSILDVAVRRVVQTADVDESPDQVAFSDELAYIRHRGSSTLLTIPLDVIGDPTFPVSVIDVPGGERPFGEGSRPTPAVGILQAPGAAAVLIANPADEIIYYYKEGMAAPMGSFRNYDRQPRAVLVVDRSLEESSPGSYETVARLRSPGRYNLSLYLDSPRFVHCFDVAVDRNYELERARLDRAPLEVEYLLDDRVVEAGSTFPLRLRLLDPATREPRTGVADVSVLYYRPPGTDNRREWAKEVSPGIYEVPFHADAAGPYYVFVHSASQGLPYELSRPMVVQAVAAGGATSPAG